MSLLRFVTVFAALVFAAVRVAGAAQPLKLCDDAAGWPPYTYVDPKNPSTVVGASKDLIFGILQRAGYEPQLTLLPWKRCLAEVEAGRTAMLINATSSEERVQKFLLSKPYYRVNSALFYLQSKYPVAPKMESLADLQAHRYCGLFGYNYTMYDIPASQLDTGAKDESSRFDMLRLGRCDFVLGDVELLDAFAAMGTVDLRGTRHIPIPGAKPKDFHAMVSRNIEGADKLLRLIDEGLQAAKADKSYARIFGAYGL